jgi:hypothetical protein
LNPDPTGGQGPYQDFPFRSFRFLYDPIGPFRVRVRPRVAPATGPPEHWKEPATPTLVIAPDLTALYAAPRTTVDKWRGKGWLGEPAAHASDTDIYVFENLREILAAHLAPPANPRGRIPIARPVDTAVLAAVRARATVPACAVPVGVSEIAYCLHLDPRRVSDGFSGRAARGRVMPQPLAVLGPPLAGTREARRVVVWDLAPFATWPGFDRGRGTELLERNRIG